MPIDYSKYPPTWKQTRARILARAENCCEECGVPNGAVIVRPYPEEPRICRDSDGGQPLTPGQLVHCGGGFYRRAVRIVLTVAHLDEDGPLDCPDNRLMALCQRCHLRRDAEMHKRNAAATRERKKHEGTAALF